ncbi:MAG: hypothetical protein RI894_82, partial [Bacteroidota bacterium]
RATLGYRRTPRWRLRPRAAQCAGRPIRYSEGVEVKIVEAKGVEMSTNSSFYCFLLNFFVKSYESKYH